MRKKLMNHRRFAACSAAALLIAAAVGGTVRAADPRVDFNRDVRAILSDACFKCHGPDAAQRKAELRLDTKEGLFGESKAGLVIVPGKPGESELISRITSTDPEARMPPADSGKTLTPAQVETLRRWVADGAAWQQHWSFVPPKRPPLPKLREARLLQEAGLVEWPRNAIDYFVLDRLLREGLRPSPEADRATLIRRVSLDLTGLPPTPEEVERFSPTARRTLTSGWSIACWPRRATASGWRCPGSNAARYADTSGYQNDGPRIMWRWRDWVIDAFNANHAVRPVHDRAACRRPAAERPRSTSGSPPASTAITAATPKAASSPRSTQVEYVVDRVETTSTVWLGLTMGCARCHDHKFDPSTQREFYQAVRVLQQHPRVRPGDQGRQLAAVRARRPRATRSGSSSACARRPTKRLLLSRSSLRSWPPPSSSGSSEPHSAETVDWAPIGAWWRISA